VATVLVDSAYLMGLVSFGVGANKNPAGIRGEVATAKLLTIEGKPYISLLYITDN